MSHNNHETNTGASRLLFLSSADGNNLSGNPNLITETTNSSSKSPRNIDVSTQSKYSTHFL